MHIEYGIYNVFYKMVDGNTPRNIVARGTKGGEGEIFAGGFAW